MGSYLTNDQRDRLERLKNDCIESVKQGIKKLYHLDDYETAFFFQHSVKMETGKAGIIHKYIKGEELGTFAIVNPDVHFILLIPKI